MGKGERPILRSVIHILVVSHPIPPFPSSFIFTDTLATSFSSRCSFDFRFTGRIRSFLFQFVSPFFLFNRPVDRFFIYLNPSCALLHQLASIVSSRHLRLTVTQQNADQHSLLNPRVNCDCECATR